MKFYYINLKLQIVFDKFTIKISTYRAIHMINYNNLLQVGKINDYLPSAKFSFCQ